jgi:hypothetical protein
VHPEGKGKHRHCQTAPANVIDTNVIDADLIDADLIDADLVDACWRRQCQ